MVMFINLVLIPYLRKNENASKKEFGGTLMEQVIYSDILQDYVFHLMLDIIIQVSISIYVSIES